MFQVPVVLCAFEYMITFNMATLEVAYMIMTILQIRKQAQRSAVESKQWNKDSNSGGRRSRDHALWLEAGVGGLVLS